MSKHELCYYDPFDFNDALFNEFLYPMRKELGNKKMFKCDIKEKKDKYEIIIDVPSFKKEEIDISLNQGFLTVRCEHKNTCDDGECKEEKPHRYLRRERFYGLYERSFYVGESVKDSDVSAKVEFGVLKINILKNTTKEELSKKIEIK